MASPEYDSSYESNASPMDSPRTSDDAGLKQTLEQRERAQLPAPTPLAAPLPVHVPDSTATIKQPSYPAPLAAPTPATLPAPLCVHISSTATIGQPSSAP